MLRHFKSEETELIWHGIVSRKLPPDIQQVARRKLRMLDSAKKIEDLRIPPNNRLEVLKGKRKGQHSIRINDQWRLCFSWDEGMVDHVEIVDYHK